MRGRTITRVLALTVAATVGATVGGQGSRDVAADPAGAAEPQIFDTLGSAGDDDGELDNPRGVAVSRTTGDVFVADTGNDRIVQYDADGRFVRTLGETPIDGVPLDQPWDVAMSASNAQIFVADTGNDRIVIYNVDSGIEVGHWGTTGSGAYRFRSPRGVTVGNDGSIYVADTGNNRVKVYDGGRTHVATYGTTGSGPGQFRGPRDVAVNLTAMMFVTDTGNDRVSVWDLVTDTFVRTFGSTGTGNRRFEAPAGIWEAGNNPATESMFIADTGNDRISVWSYDEVTDVATWESTFGATGDENEELEAPRNITIGDDLRRYVIDSGNDRLALLDPSGPPGIYGRVTNTFGAGAGNVVVLAQDATTFDPVVVAEADRDGTYQLPLPPGDYLLTFFDPDGGHVPEYFPDHTNFGDAEPVEVLADTVTRIDTTLSVTANPLPSTGVIRGTVNEPAGPAARTWALAVNANTGQLVQGTQVDPAGHYRIDGLPTANYLVLFLDPRGVNASEFHDDTLDPAQADPVAVSSSGPAVVVSATLAPLP